MEIKLVEFTVEEAMNAAGKNLLDYYDFEDFEEYLEDANIFRGFFMEDLNKVLSDSATMDSIDTEDAGKGFSIDDKYFAFNEYGRLYSMTEAEYRAEVIAYTNVDGFMAWIDEWTDCTYHDMIEDLEESLMEDGDYSDDIEIEVL